MVDSSSDVAKQVLRETARLLLELNRIGFATGPDETQERSAIDSLILATALHANVAAIRQDPVLQRRYGPLDEPPPDDLRRPIPTRALADTLGLPAETVRRRVKRMAEAGRLKLTPQGVVVHREAVTGARYVQIVTENWRALGRTYRRLRELHLLPPPAPVAAPARHEDFPLRAGLRIWTHHLLRSTDVLTRHVGGLQSMLTLLAILRANSEDGAPISVAALAKRLDLPFETMRRNVARLIDEGRCVRTPAGLMFPPGALDGPDWTRIAEINLKNLVRFYEALAEQNLLTQWETSAAVRVEPSNG